jgi:hypothetical protein
LKYELDDTCDGLEKIGKPLRLNCLPNLEPDRHHGLRRLTDKSERAGRGTNISSAITLPTL